MGSYPTCILLTRVGDFYELYYEQADEAGPLLEIQVVTRKIRNHHYRFTGFPARYIDRHLERLVMEHQRHVAICEQFQDSVTKQFTRRLVRIITPGTLIDEQFIHSDQNNFLLAIVPANVLTGSIAGDLAPTHSLGLAWLDLSTGDFMTASTTMSELASDLARIKPREVLLPSEYHSMVHPHVETAFRAHDRYVITPKPLNWFRSGGTPVPQESVWSTAPGSTEQCATATSIEHLAGHALTRYVTETQAGKPLHLQTSTHYNSQQVMRIDNYTLRSLELLESMTTGLKAGSLVQAIDHTKTKAGSRLLAEYLRSPLTSVEPINERLDLVEYFHKAPDLLHCVQSILRTARDAQRAIQKLSLGYGGPQDLLDIASALEAGSQVREACGELSPDRNPLAKWFDALDPLHVLVKSIRQHIHFDAPRRVQVYGFLIADSSDSLAKLHQQLRTLEQETDTLQVTLQTQNSLNSVKLISSGGSRHYLEMTARDAKAISHHPSFQVYQTLKGKHRYSYAPWTRLADQIHDTKQQIFEEEISLYQGLVRDALLHRSTIVTNSRILAQIDVATSFAQLARDFNYVRPTFTSAPGVCRIVGGRHPVVEMTLRARNRHFIHNDCDLDPIYPTALVTGPNMGGKSTFLRQNAIIITLAHIGSFVPAISAELSPVDRLFSRVGASDNLAEEQSTFMVEMRETAHILQHMTPQSFVIMDEVGRGTATTDGMAIAYAALFELAQRVGCRSIMATHYHELTDWAQSTMPRMRYLCTSVYTDESGAFSFIHKVLPGISRQSHGLQVAQLAGFPPSALATARQMHTHLTKPEIPTTMDGNFTLLSSGVTSGENYNVEKSTTVKTYEEDTLAREKLHQIEHLVPTGDIHYVTPSQAIECLQQIQMLLKTHTKED
ncbi:MutS protein 1 [Dispira simplex]|nr:MutS protein 1 [Dispira simplex]